MQPLDVDTDEMVLVQAYRRLPADMRRRLLRTVRGLSDKSLVADMTVPPPATTVDRMVALASLARIAEKRRRDLNLMPVVTRPRATAASPATSAPAASGCVTLATLATLPRLRQR